MMSTSTKLVSSLATVLLLGFALAGCFGAPDTGDTDGRATGLVEVSTSIVPLTPVTSNAWQRAPRDCHGRLPSDVHFELVREGLVVAIDSMGNPLCVDTIDNVQQELDDDGRRAEAANLEDAYLLAVGLAIPATDIGAGDPSPQPSTDDMDTSPADPADGAGIDEGDPSPQPSTEPCPEPGDHGQS